MDKKRDEFRALLKPLMACSVSERYALLYATKFGKRHLATLNLQGSIFDVCLSIESTVERFGGVDELIEELKQIPVPEWWKG